MGRVGDSMSFPTWERGLKYCDKGSGKQSCIVVPHVGTWIEITSLAKNMISSNVVPHVGTWIEISEHKQNL